MDKTIKDEKSADRFKVVRKKLVEMKQGLIRESKAEITQFLNIDDKYSGVSDDGDLADVACRDALQAANLTRHQARLRAIEEALLRIDEGTYGTCEDCGEEISVGRLKVIPFALRCVECQEILEIAASESEE